MRLLLLLLLGMSQAAFASPKNDAVTVVASSKTAKIAIIIDDVGYQYQQVKALMDLPFALTYAILPNTPYAKRLAEYAHQHNKEVLVHLPMEGSRQEIFEPQTLTTSMKQAEFKRMVSHLLKAVPYAVGVNNHMGSVLTQHPTQMQWLMETLSAHADDLFFIDSFTTPHSQAYSQAKTRNIPSLQRDYFLDNELDPASIRLALQRVINRAQQTGSAIAIAHPHTITLDVIRHALSALPQSNTQLVSVSELLL